MHDFPPQEYRLLQIEQPEVKVRNSSRDLEGGRLDVVGRTVAIPPTSRYPKQKSTSLTAVTQTYCSSDNVSKSHG